MPLNVLCFRSLVFFSAWSLHSHIARAYIDVCGAKMVCSQKKKHARAFTLASHILIGSSKMSFWLLFFSGVAGLRQYACACEEFSFLSIAPNKDYICISQNVNSRDKFMWMNVWLFRWGSFKRSHLFDYLIKYILLMYMCWYKRG